jgi:hypothetical protein
MQRTGISGSEEPFFSKVTGKDESVSRIISVLILIDGATSGFTLFAGGVIITAYSII